MPSKRNKFSLALCLLLLSSSAALSQTRVQLVFVDGFSDEEKEKVEMNIDKLEKVLNSSEFKKKVQEAKFVRRRIKQYKRRFSSEEILQLILGGKELNSEYDSMITMKLKLYDSEKNEIGHTDKDLVINTFRGYLANNPIEDYLSHILHEYCHVMGFRHAFYRLPFRSKSVPYALGNIVLELLQND